LNDFVERARAHFDTLCDDLFANLAPGEDATINMAAEDTLFMRFNASRVRQNTDVEQRVLSLQLQTGGRTVEHSRTLCGVLETDRASVLGLLADCRKEAGQLPPDPHQVPITNHGSSDAEFGGLLLSARDVVDAVAVAASGCDLAGLYSGGAIVRANRNSRGQRHWFATATFVLDYSLYDGALAAKGVYAGAFWDNAQWARTLSHTQTMLALMGRPAQRVPPGAWRTYLAPQAFSELVGMLGWGALSAAAWKQGRSPFKKLAEKQARLSPLLSVQENFGLGLVPRFNGLGETSPAQLELIRQGELANLLVSSRTAAEYGLQSNGASEGEGPRALDVLPGTLPESDVLRELGNGLLVSNLHYLNWSDPVSARVTGMTRYACFRVEGGEIIGPLAADLRWDESLYDALGDKLLALSTQADIDPATGTYYQRALGGSRVPGALVDRFTFTS